MKNKVKNLLDNCMTMFKKFPLELTLGIAVALVILINEDVYSWFYNCSELSLNDDYPIWLLFVLASPFFFMVIYLANLHRKKGYYYTAIYPVLGTFLLDAYIYEHDELMWGIAGIHLIAFLSGGWRKSNREFVYDAVTVMKNTVYGLLICLVVFGAIFSLQWGVMLLFDIPEGSWGEIIEMFCISITFLVWMGSFLTLNEKSRRASLQVKTNAYPVLHIVVNYVLSPIILVYTAIFFLYLVKIILKWDLPKGQIVYVVLPYLLLGIGSIALRQLLDKRQWVWLDKYFAQIALPALLLLWLGVLVRVYNYGFTPARIALLCVVITITLYMLFSLVKSLFFYRNFSVATMVMWVLYFCILPKPAICAYSQHWVSISGEKEADNPDSKDKSEVDFSESDKSY